MADHTLALHPATVGAGSFDPSAVVFVDDRLAFGVEEERLVGEKHAPDRFPTHAVEACLRYCDVDLADVGRVVVPWDEEATCAAVERRLAAMAPGASVPHVDGFGHHRSHAASAFFPAGFDEAVVVTADGRGNRFSTAVWVGHDDDLRVVAGFEPPNSLGYLYAAVTAYLGFEPFGGEGKLMALAAYGECEPTIESGLRSLVDTGADYDVTGLVGEGVPTAVGRLERLFGRRPARPADPSDPWATDLAAVTQTLLEETVGALVDRHCRRAGIDRVCLAGGVALNCKLNRQVAESSSVDRLYVQPVAHDAGAPIGAGLLVLDDPRAVRLDTLALGPACRAAEAERLAVARGLRVDRPDDLVTRVADRLTVGALVGWVQGRAELGPRALGQRSVLADPRSRDAAARVNAFVKGRESWRPLSPSLPTGVAERYLESPRPSPYMVDAFAATPAARSMVPAVVHPADGTTRPQTVEETTHPRYHDLLTAVGDRTGVPVLLNTSLNTSGAPIATTARDALDTFASTALDLLVVDDLVVR